MTEEKAEQMLAFFEEAIDIENMPLDDKETYELFQRADVDGIFMMESDWDKYDLLQVKDVNYKSDPGLVKCVNREVDLERDMGGVSRLYKQKYTLEERIERGKEWLESHAFFTLKDYAAMNNLSRTTASLELKDLTHGDDAPFDYTGRGSHKVWVKKG